MQAPALESTQLDADTWYPPFRQAAVLGAGVMGAQIAAHLANAGLNVLLLDVAPKTIGQDGPNNALVEAAFKQASRLKPDPFMSEAAKRRVSLGNFEDDFAKIGACDWIIEVVVERMDVKRGVMKQIEEHASETAIIVASNTSGLRISDIVEGRGDGLQEALSRDAFLQPGRATEAPRDDPDGRTDHEALERIALLHGVHLGKGVVIGKDTPNFIGNRIGVSLDDAHDRDARVRRLHD